MFLKPVLALASHSLERNNSCISEACVLQGEGRASILEIENRKPQRQIILLTLRKLCLKISRGRSSVYEAMNAKNEKTFDPLFPKPIRIGRRIFFVEHEVDAYLELCIDASRKVITS